MYCRLIKAYDNVYSQGKSPDLGGVYLKQGILLEQNLLPESMSFSIDYSEGGTFPDYINVSGALLCSQRFIDLLKRAGVDNIQTFPVALTNDYDGMIYDNYCICNIVGLVSCADLSTSSYTHVMDDLYIFEKLVIDTDKIHSELLFRLKEDPTIIIIHASVCNYIVDHELEPETEGFDWEELRTVGGR